MRMKVRCTPRKPENGSALKLTNYNMLSA